MPDHIAQMCRTVELTRLSTKILTVYLVTTSQQPTVAPSWIDEIRVFIELCTLPKDQGKVARVMRRTPPYEIADDQLYNRPIGGPLLKCLLSNQAKEVMNKCITTSAPSTRVPTLYCERYFCSYYWLSMVYDCISRV